MEVRGLRATQTHERDMVFRLLDEGEFAHMTKVEAWSAYEAGAAMGDTNLTMAAWGDMEIPEALRNALVEVVTA